MNSTKKKIALISLLSFCAFELLDWTGITHGGFPRDWTMALIQICVNIGWTAFFTVLSYFLMIRPQRQSSDENSRGPTQGAPKGESESHASSNR